LLFLILAVTTCRHSADPGGTSTSALKILVAEDGVYEISQRDLQDHNFNNGELDPAALALTTNGEPVPFVIWEERLVFYGQATESRYTSHRAYILTAGEAGLVMDNQAAPLLDGPIQETVPRRLHLEENNFYTSEIPSAAVDGPWFWQPVRNRFEVQLTLPPIADGSGAVTTNLYGTTHHPEIKNDHSLTLLVNSIPQGELIWEGQNYYTGTMELPAGTLQSGENTLALENIPEDYLDFSNLNWFAIEYAAPARPAEGLLSFSGLAGQVAMRGFQTAPLILDIADPDRPEHITGWTYDADMFPLGVNATMHIVAVIPDGLQAPPLIIPQRESTLHDPAQQADLLVITTETLAPGLSDLIAAREAEGLRVVLALVEDIYDGFGFGMEGPNAIHNFIRYTAQEWTAPAPRYVLLVGDATTDYHGYLANRPENPVARPENIVPAPLVPVNFSGETVSDSRLVDVDGDRMPDMAIGRWPVSNLEQVTALVQRTLAYEQGTATSRALFAADGSEREFSRLTRRLIADSEFPANEAEVLSGAVSSEVAANWNDGAWLVVYTGHGSLELWGKEDVFSVAAVGQLSSGETAPPIVLQLTCLSGLFAHPEVNSLSEVMLTHEQGPVLLIGATSLTYSFDQEPFARGLLAGLRNRELPRIGDVFQEAKLSLDISNEGVREVNDTFILFGDPSARVLRP
jgi:hypothetical protein